MRQRPSPIEQVDLAFLTPRFGNMSSRPRDTTTEAWRIRRGIIAAMSPKSGSGQHWSSVKLFMRSGLRGSWPATRAGHAETPFGA